MSEEKKKQLESIIHPAAEKFAQVLKENIKPMQLIISERIKREWSQNPHPLNSISFPEISINNPTKDAIENNTLQTVYAMQEARDEIFSAIKTKEWYEKYWIKEIVLIIIGIVIALIAEKIFNKD